jgi:hypothetical protein
VCETPLTTNTNCGQCGRVCDASSTCINQECR